MGSTWGKRRKMVCPVCGLHYDRMRLGMSFKQVRNLIISIGWCTKMKHVKNGRRNGVLDYMHELKLNMWKEHVETCDDAQRNPIDPRRRDELRAWAEGRA